NHLNAVRFAGLANPGVAVWGDVSRALTLPPAGFVVFDAPWYLDDLVRWLTIASHVCRSGGELLFPLFPEWIRPTARNERFTILDLASQIGRVNVQENFLVYSTPQFEAAALAAAGVSASST